MKFLKYIIIVSESVSQPMPGACFGFLELTFLKSLKSFKLIKIITYKIFSNKMLFSTDKGILQKINVYSMT